VDRDNWLNNAVHTDTFSVAVLEQKVTVQRTDKNEGWGLDLKISCCYNNIQTCTSCSNGNSSYSCMSGKYQNGALCSGSGFNDTQTCSVCTTCGTGKRQTTACSSGTNRVCAQNICDCANGVKATGTACTTNNANICSYCSSEYYKTVDTCTGCTTCSTGTRETTPCTSEYNRACTQNICLCTNGVKAEGTSCTNHNANICLSCSSGFYKNSDVCTACTTCGTGTRETTACTSESNRVCTQNVCSCANGVAATGTECTTHDAIVCSSCDSGYTKNTTCVDINECAPQPCKNGGACRNDVNDYTCTCAAGYDGKNCTNDIDDCLSDPCQNGGECVDQVNSYVCTCVAGYDGVHCTNNIDDCKDSNTEVWVSEGGFSAPYYYFYSDSTCAASKTVFDTDTEYTFRRCHNSTSHPFSIGGATGITGTDQLSFTTGKNDTMYECTSHSQMVHTLTVTEYNPCRNGSCVDGIDTYTCQCDLGWTGTTCKNMNKCTCANGYGALGANCPQIKEKCTSCANKFSLVGNRCEPNIVLRQTLGVSGVETACIDVNQNILTKIISDILQLSSERVNITSCTQSLRNSRRLLSVDTNTSLVIGVEVSLLADTTDSEVLITVGKMENIGTNSSDLCRAFFNQNVLRGTCQLNIGKVVCTLCNRHVLGPSLPTEAFVLSGNEIFVVVFATLAMVVTTVQCGYLCCT